MKIKKENGSSSKQPSNNVLAVKGSKFHHILILIIFPLLLIVVLTKVEFVSRNIIGFCVALVVLFWPFINSLIYLLRNPYVLIINRRGIYSEEEEFIHWKFISAYKFIETSEMRSYLTLVLKNKKIIYIEITTIKADYESIKAAIQKNAPETLPEFLGIEVKAFGKLF